MNRDRHPLLGRGCDLLFAIVLLADYLFLTISYVLVGQKANWLLLAGATQFAILALAWPLGRLSGFRVTTPTLGILGIGLLLLGHATAASVDGSGLTAYGTTKVWAFFGLAIPAFFLGAAIGNRERLPGSAWIPLLAAPLLAMCCIAIATDREKMTIAWFEDPAVFAGCLVLPVHQALAFALGKLGLFAHVRSTSPEARGRALWALGIGLCLALALLSGSRGYLVAAVAGLLAQWAFVRGSRWILTLTAAVPVGYYIWFAAPVLREGLDPARVANSYSMMERGELWTAAFAAFAERPLFGHGPGGFATWFGWDQRVYPHNLGLEVLSELGLVGALCFLAVLLPAGTRILALWARRKPLTEAQLFSIGFFVFALVGSLGVADLIRNYFFFCAIGMVTASCRQPESARAAVAARTQRLAVP